MAGDRHNSGNRASKTHGFYSVVLTIGLMLVILALAFLAVVMTQSVLSLNSKGVYGNENQIQPSIVQFIPERERIDTGSNQRREVLPSQPREQSRGALSEGTSVE